MTRGFDAAKFNRAIRDAQRQAEAQLKREIDRVNRENRQRVAAYNREVERINRENQRRVDDHNRKADQHNMEFPRYGGHLLTESCLVGEDVRYAEDSAVLVGVPPGGRAAVAEQWSVGPAAG
jgi:hypothetical protein